MKTRFEKIDALRPEKALVQEAGVIIRQGGLVAFPTETVYGLGGNALDEKAAEKIYAAKGRPSDNPLIAHIAHLDMLYELVTEVSEKAEKLMDAFWPGPMTLVFYKKPIVPMGTTGGLDTVAVRMPAHPVALQLIEEAGVPIAAPSANLSGRPSPTRADHVREDLDGRIDMILDSGDVRIGLESTIFDMTVEPPMILRPGYITKEMAEEVIGKVTVDQAILSDQSKVAPKAPGMKYRHYAPKAPLTVVAGEPEMAAEKMKELALQAKAAGKKVGIICTDEMLSRFGEFETKSIGSRFDPDAIGHNLYRILREFDETGAEVIYSESFASDSFGQAIMNRLMKAAGQHKIEVS